MAKDRQSDPLGDAGGLLGGLGNLIKQLGELAARGAELREAVGREPGGREAGGSKVEGVYGFTIRTVAGGKEPSEVKIEPFGNVRPDETTGRPTVRPVREPITDLFDEPGGLLVVAEMPGVCTEDVRLSLADGVLTITAEGRTRYHKEVRLPGSFSAAGMSHTCRNGLLEVKLPRA
jgi:HSP20 family protein